jgi:hypothetical protein
VELEDAIDIEIHGQLHPRGIDGAIAVVAERQHGVIARRQLSAIGAGRGAIDHRVWSGRLRPIHRGVYGVGHRVLSPEGHWMAAVLATGPGAVLSHRSAAALWALRPTARARVEITTERALHARPGIHTHRAVLAPTKSLPTTASPPPHRRERCRSELEARFTAFLDDAVLPRPSTNSRIEGTEVDFAWPEHRLIAELDGFAFHATRRAFEQDRARDRRLQAYGWRVVRITWRQLHEDRK